MGGIYPLYARAYKPYIGLYSVGPVEPDRKEYS
jgi:hypothetical protein